jgi:hypothetical protein
MLTRGIALGAPITSLDSHSPIRYVSKYPNHPINMGYTDYPKYWEGQGYNPADFPPPQITPRIPFYPCPYSNAWKAPADFVAPIPAAPPVVPAPAPEPKPIVEELPKYTPPHYFPDSPTPALDAIRYYAAKQVAENEAAAAAQQNVPQQNVPQ